MRKVRRDASVPIDAAAELARVDVITIRRWSADGLLAIERRGDIEAVRLAEVDLLAAGGARRGTGERNGQLRSLLREAPTQEPVDINGLQEQIRDRMGSLRLVRA